MQQPPSAEDQAATRPADAVALLRDGNARFVAGEPRPRDPAAAAAAAVDGQHPLAAIVGCVDSRVPPELVFDLGIGEAFVARVAGTVVDDDVLGSLEFATRLAGTPAIVVLGHSACGAVEGAMDGAELGHLTGLLAKIRPAVVEASGGPEAPGSDDPALVQRTVEANVTNSVAAILGRSDVIRELHEAGTVTVEGAVYDLATREVTWLDPA